MGMKRKQNKGWRRIALLAVFFAVLASLKVMATPSMRRPVVHFIHFYQQSEDMGLWGRFVYGLVEARSNSHAN